MSRVELPIPHRTAPTDGIAEFGASVLETGRSAGLAAVGIASTAVFEDTRRHLYERRRLGLNGSMQFTYRNPDRSTDPTRILPSARAMVVGAWGYRHSDRAEDAEDPRADRPTGRVARYARADHYGALRRALEPIAVLLRQHGWRAVVVCDDNALVDRAAAHRAGIGWFGKNSLLLLPGLGSWFVLGSVVTDAPLTSASEPQPLPHAEGCGACTRCLRSCPTGAIVAPGVLDARRCLAWLVQAPGSFPEEYRHALGDRMYGCDECQQACPINKAVAPRKPVPDISAEQPADQTAGPKHPGRPNGHPGHPNGHPGHPGRPNGSPTVNGGAVDILDILDMPDDELMEAHGRWYIPERDPRYLRRNALVVLGNVGRGDDPDVVRALRRWLAADDAMLGEHARWAARKLGRSDLLPASP